jgi:hypothetical protein
MTPIEIGKIHAEINKLMAETIKLGAETAKMQRERAWYPIVIVTSAVAAAVALTKMLIG